MDITRESSSYLLKHLSRFEPNRPVLLVEGARQVGKTCLVLDLLRRPEITSQAHVIRCNLETDRILREEINLCDSFKAFTSLLADHFGFNPQHPTVLFIDEAQESERLGTFVRSMKEEWGPVRTILSGSSMLRLFAPEVRIPVGRIMRFVLPPFSFREFLAACGKFELLALLQDFPAAHALAEPFHTMLLRELDNYLQVGGLPDAVRAFAQGEDYKPTRRSIFLGQEEDFLRKEDVSLQHLFRDALRGVATHVGTPSKLVHISEHRLQARKILNQLQAWHLVLMLEQRGTNVTTAFHPKRYLYDVGIAHEVRAAPFPRLSVIGTLSPVLRTDLGGLLENYALLQLKAHRLGQTEISSWKKSHKETVEVDFVVQAELPIPVECKSCVKLNGRSFQYVQSYLELTGLPCGFVVSAAPFAEERRRGKRLINLPLYLCSYEVISALAGEA